MLIDVSYFTAGSRHILNATLGTASTMVNDTIMGFVSTYQEDFLRDMLGDIGGDINAYLVELDENVATEPIAEYDEVCGQLRQSFADYVFFQILRTDNTQATITGLKKLKDGDNQFVSPIERGVMVWNRMVKRNRRFLRWCEEGRCPVKGIRIERKMLTTINTFNL